MNICGTFNFFVVILLVYPLQSKERKCWRTPEILKDLCSKNLTEFYAPKNTDLEVYSHNLYNYIKSRNCEDVESLCRIYVIPCMGGNFSKTVFLQRKECEKLRKDCDPTLNCTNQLSNSRRIGLPLSTSVCDTKLLLPSSYDYSIECEKKSLKLNNCGISCNIEIIGADSSDSQLISITIFWNCILIILSSVVALATVLLNRQRFTYPQQPIVFMTVCYLCLAITWIISRVNISSNHHQQQTSNSACLFEVGERAKLLSKEHSHRSESDFLKNLESVVVQGSYSNNKCTIIFILNYYFSFAATLWWLVLTYSWLLSAVLKWSEEAVSAWNRRYHLFSWIIPGIFTLIAIVRNDIGGDPLAQMCFPGGSGAFGGDIFAIKLYSLAPEATLLSIGLAFISAGLAAMARVRRNVKRDYNENSTKSLVRFDKLLRRIFLFCGTFVILKIILLICLSTEVTERDHWLITHHTNIGNESPICLEKNNCKISIKLFLLKYFSILAPGILSASYILISRKTVNDWQRIICSSGDDHVQNEVQIKTPLTPMPQTTKILTQIPPTSNNMGMMTNTDSLRTNIPTAVVNPHPIHSAHILPSAQMYMTENDNQHHLQQ